MKEKAEAYLDGIIQVTVFQDSEEAFNVSEGLISKEVAEIQKTSFREIYIENTEANMSGNIIEEKYFELLADGFLTAIGKTTYEIVDSQFHGMDEVVVVTIEKNELMITQLVCKQKKTC